MTIAELLKMSQAELDDLFTKSPAGEIPKGEAKGRIVPVRFTADDLKAIAVRAKAANQNVSEWIRSTIHANLEA